MLVKTLKEEEEEVRREWSNDLYETWLVCKANICCWFCYRKRRHFLLDDFSLVCPLSVMSQFNIRSHLRQEAAAETSYITCATSFTCDAKHIRYTSQHLPGKHKQMSQLVRIDILKLN